MKVSGLNHALELCNLSKHSLEVGLLDRLLVTVLGNVPQIKNTTPKQITND